MKKVDYLNLFVNSLVDADRGKELEFMKPQLEEDLIAKSHEEFFAKFKEEKSGKAPAFEKVNRICDALRQELETVNTDNVYLLPILTTYIKK